MNTEITLKDLFFYVSAAAAICAVIWFFTFRNISYMKKIWLIRKIAKTQDKIAVQQEKIKQQLQQVKDQLKREISKDIH